jgi:hypothetical protein
MVNNLLRYDLRSAGFAFGTVALVVELESTADPDAEVSVDSLLAFESDEPHPTNMRPLITTATAKTYRFIAYLRRVLISKHLFEILIDLQK